jgi:hypothetical protein
VFTTIPFSTGSKRLHWRAFARPVSIRKFQKRFDTNWNPTGLNSFEPAIPGPRRYAVAGSVPRRAAKLFGDAADRYWTAARFTGAAAFRPKIRKRLDFL